MMNQEAKELTGIFEHAKEYLDFVQHPEPKYGPAGYFYTLIDELYEMNHENAEELERHLTYTFFGMDGILSQRENLEAYFPRMITEENYEEAESAVLEYQTMASTASNVLRAVSLAAALCE